MAQIFYDNLNFMLEKDNISNSTTTSKVADYYSDGGLKKKIQNAIKEAGLDLETLTIEDLAAVDEFHIGGKKATNITPVG